MINSVVNAVLENAPSRPRSCGWEWRPRRGRLPGRQINAHERGESYIREAVATEISHSNGRPILHDAARATGVAVKNFQRRRQKGFRTSNPGPESRLPEYPHHRHLSKSAKATGIPRDRPRESALPKRTGTIIDENCDGVRIIFPATRSGLPSPLRSPTAAIWA